MSHDMQDHLRTGHSKDSWQNMVHWRRQWQPTPVFSSGEPYVQYEKAKIYDIGRWASQAGRCPLYYWGRAAAAAAAMTYDVRHLFIWLLLSAYLLWWDTMFRSIARFKIVWVSFLEFESLFGLCWVLLSFRGSYVLDILVFHLYIFFAEVSRSLNHF